MIYSTGFGVNLGVISTLTGRDDYILWDEQDHASIIEGRRLSFSNSLKYKHNDMASLEAQLKKCEPDRVKLIVTDGVFSMEGDVCKLPDIVDLAHKYNANIMVDEAHGIGVFGEGGRGVCDHFGLRDEVDLIMAENEDQWNAARDETLRKLEDLGEPEVFEAYRKQWNAATEVIVPLVREAQISNGIEPYTPAQYDRFP